MAAFFKNIWKWLAIFFGGIIAGLVAAMKLLDPKTEINAGTYVKDQKQETKIGTVKQKNGTGNLLDVDQVPEQAASESSTASRKKKREQRKSERKSRRASRKGVLSDQEENEEV
ncbi:MAG: hypothetical protein AB2L24_21950 [Mangrovibacterium sp.]